MAIENRFEIIRAIHVGQIATAYEAIQKELDRKVLLKVIHPQWTGDAELTERFSREGKAIAKIDHPNVVRVFDSGWEGDLPYLALEWVEGESLAQCLAGGPLSQTAVLRLAEELLKGLGAVHEAGLLHRDIKPDNIMIAKDGTARLTDFSLVGFGRASMLTGHDAIVGSPAYLAPELLGGAPPDARSDLYGLGVVLFEALTGSNPFETGDPFSTLDRVRTMSAPKLSGKGQIDARLGSLVDALLSKDREQRPVSSEKCLELLGVQSPLTHHPKLLNHQLLPVWTAGAIVVAGVVALLTILYSGRIGAPIESPAPRIPDLKPRLQKDRVFGGSATYDSSINVVSSMKEGENTATPLQTSRVKSAAAIQTALLKIIVEPWAEVFIDGGSMGTTPLGNLELPAGLHHLRLQHPSFPTVTRDLQLSAGVTDTLKVDMREEASEAFISAEPWGYLYVDSDSLGLLPHDGPIWLSPGKHRLCIRHPQYGSWSDSVLVARGTQTEITVNLERGTMVAIPKAGDTDESVSRH